MDQENILEPSSQQDNVGSNENINNDDDLETCTICGKSYKTKDGLVQHENEKHSEHHEYPLNIPSPQYYLIEFKKKISL
jgi:hypothetical protein